MASRTFSFDGPPYLGAGVRVFIALTLGPLFGCILSGVALLLVKNATGQESTAAAIAGGLLGWGAVAALVIKLGGKPTQGSVVIDSEKLVRTWRGHHQEMKFVDLATCELVPEQWVKLTANDGKVLVVEAPGADLALIDQEIRARKRRDRQ